MVEKRPYIILLAFIVGAVLTPPDVLSQTLLAVPIWLLFEVGLFFSRLLVPRHVP
jgi:sec-independent protein translocase protein TatC